MAHDERGQSPWRRVGAGAMVAALGVVFGDIGTSPLYALQAALGALGDRGADPVNVVGVVSLIFWALALVVAIKYVTIVMRADNEGEGGILALVSLVAGDGQTTTQRLTPMVVIGVLGAALLYGDGAITPAISVLSAIEGLKVQAPDMAPLVIPLAVSVLVLLFAMQRRGTGSLGALFGPIMTLWFAILAGLGIEGIIAEPAILAALDPRSALLFAGHEPAKAFAVFGLVFLALTGAEALYADMGHFGATPIRKAWFLVAYPALTLNYFGQGAQVLAQPAALDNPFFRLVPPPLLIPMVILATAATVIASQALISGVFSLTHQAIFMRLMPRMTVSPTSSQSAGQIYVPVVNWLLMVMTLLIAVGFRSSDNLANAYGVAVSATMLFTTVLLYRAMTHIWHWPWVLAAAATVVFSAIDGCFFVANSAKVTEGGWLPLAIGSAMALAMLTWRIGSNAVHRGLNHDSVPISAFLDRVDEAVLARIPGCGVFVTRLGDTVSPVILHHLHHNRVLHEHVVLLTVDLSKRPRVPATERVTVTDLGHGFLRMIVKIGFMQRPDVPTALRACVKLGYGFCSDVHYYIAHESLVRAKGPGRLPGVVWGVFNVLHRLGLRAADYFNLPVKRVMEVGFRLAV